MKYYIVEANQTFVDVYDNSLEYKENSRLIVHEKRKDNLEKRGLAHSIKELEINLDSIDIEDENLEDIVEPTTIENEDSKDDVEQTNNKNDETAEETESTAIENEDLKKSKKNNKKTSSEE